MLNNDKTIEDIAQHYDDIILSGKYLKVILSISLDEFNYIERFNLIRITKTQI